MGQGAIAEVVRARDEETGAEVALKILYPDLRENQVVVERFRREVEWCGGSGTRTCCASTIWSRPTAASSW